MPRWSGLKDTVYGAQPRSQWPRIARFMSIPLGVYPGVGDGPCDRDSLLILGIRNLMAENRGAADREYKQNLPSSHGNKI
jgi:hypothetical protein